MRGLLLNVDTSYPGAAPASELQNPESTSNCREFSMEDDHLSSEMRAHDQLLENYAAEQFIRERAIEELKNMRTDLTSKVDSAFADLEQLKETRMAADEKARELRIELETVNTSVNFKQANLSNQQQEISKTNTLLKKLEEEEMFGRDSFITIMMEINWTVREMQRAHSGPPLQPDYHSTRNESAILETSQPSCEPAIAKSSTSIIDEAGVRHKEQIGELLREIRIAESLLLPSRASLDCQQEKLQQSRHKHDAYIESINQATQALTSTRNQTEELEEQVASLTTDLQNMYVCPQCGTDNLGQATGQNN